MIDTLIICLHCGKRHRASGRDGWFLAHARDTHNLRFAETRAEQERARFVKYVADFEDYITERRAA